MSRPDPLPNANNLIALDSETVQHAYIHVPFCRSRCHYCDFYFELHKYGGIEGYLASLSNEISERLRHSVFKTSKLYTVYWGGGTPSLLSPEAIHTIHRLLQKETGFVPTAEITLEVNPEDVSRERIRAYLQAGVTRFSVGVQSFEDSILQKIGRRHRSEAAKQAICSIAAEMGQSVNLSIDLMYGLPGQTFEGWQRTLQTAVELPVQHISLYGLQLEPGTSLETLTKRASELYTLPDDEAHIRCYTHAQEVLKAHGFNLYEVSNAARGGYESRHNQAYWKQHYYWGFGPGAHGYIPHCRYNLIEDLKAYHAEQPLAAITESEPVSPWQHLENLLIFGLRMREGVAWHTLNAALPPTCSLHRLQTFLQACALRYPGALILTDQGIQLNASAIPVMNDVLVEFINLEKAITHGSLSQ
jgi:oxygen-independent coproporphyrinogen III oxidase